MNQAWGVRCAGMRMRGIVLSKVLSVLTHHVGGPPSSNSSGTLAAVQRRGPHPRPCWSRGAPPPAPVGPEGPTPPPLLVGARAGQGMHASFRTAIL